MKKRILVILFLLMAFNISYSQELIKTNDINKHFDAALFPDSIKSITVYASKECGRCENIMSILREFNVNFEEKNLSNPDVYSEIDVKINKSLPYKDLGYSIGYPIIEIDNIVFFNLENHSEFAYDLINFLKTKD